MQVIGLYSIKKYRYQRIDIKISNPAHACVYAHAHAHVCMCVHASAYIINMYANFFKIFSIKVLTIRLARFNM